MRVIFRGHRYKVVFTDHAKAQMALRALDESTVLAVIETGEIKEKGAKNKFWVFKSIGDRKDNLVSVAIAIEAPHLIVITAMVNWRPS